MSESMNLSLGNTFQGNLLCVFYFSNLLNFLFLGGSFVRMSD